MANLLLRTLETCPVCGAWDPFRKGKKGKSIMVNGGLRRIYGECRKCGVPMVVQFVKPKQDKSDSR